jgi:hypothetical protein
LYSETHSQHRKERLAPLKLSHFQKVKEMQERKEIFFWLERKISKSVLYKFRHYGCHLPAELVPQLLEGGGIKEQFWKEKFHAVNGKA